VAAAVGFARFLGWQEGLEQELKVTIEVVGQDVLVGFVDCHKNNWVLQAVKPTREKRLVSTALMRKM